MKRFFNFKSKLMLFFILSSLIFINFSCSTQQLGETNAEGHRRHKRALRTNQQELMRDIDKVLLLDEPSKLTDMRLP